MAVSTLLLETSGRSAQVGLALDDRVVSVVTLDEARRHNRDLILAARELLQGQALTPQHISRVLVSQGPGSYTGLRVGLITAKSLAYSLGCELVPVPTFSAIAAGVPAEASVVEVIADALQGLIYRQRFGVAGPDGYRSPLDQLEIVALEKWVSQLPENVQITGPGVSLLKLGKQSFPLEQSLKAEYGNVSVAALFAVGKHISPVTREELFQLEPLYLRGSSAEEKHKGK